MRLIGLCGTDHFKKKDVQIQNPDYIDRLNILTEGSIIDRTFQPLKPTGLDRLLRDRFQAPMEQNSEYIRMKHDISSLHYITLHYIISQRRLHLSDQWYGASTRSYSSFIGELEQVSFQLFFKSISVH